MQLAEAGQRGLVPTIVNFRASSGTELIWMSTNMFVQKRNDHWLLVEWREKRGVARPVILGVYLTQDEAVQAMQGRRRDDPASSHDAWRALNDD